jgi:hypothetical protein
MPNIGIEEVGKNKAPIELHDDARLQGTYIIGTTGTGKTTLLKSLIIQDMEAKEKVGMCVLDPHGDMIDDLLYAVPKHRRGDVLLFAPGDASQFESPLGLNIFECDRSDSREVGRVVSTVIDTLYKLFAYSWGPRMEDLLRHSILTLMSTPDSTFLDLLLLLSSKQHRERYTRLTDDPVLRQFWDGPFAVLEKNPRELAEVVSSSLNKVGRFLTDPIIRNVITQPRNAFDLKFCMDKKKILLVNLSKGELGEDNSTLLGSVIVNQVLIAALRRRSVPPTMRNRFHLVVDEFQNFATPSFPTLQSEARKYGITVTVAHQYRDQLDDLNKGSTLNAANLIVLRVAGRDAEELAMQFNNTPPPGERVMEPLFDRRDPLLCDLPLSQKDRKVYIQHRTNPYSRLGTTVYQEVEGPRRSYADVRMERANTLASMPNRYAVCRLVDKAGAGLTEHFVKLAMRERPKDNDAEMNPGYIRARSRQKGMYRREVEIMIRSKMTGTAFYQETGFSKSAEQPKSAIREETSNGKEDRPTTPHIRLWIPWSSKATQPDTHQS